MFVCGGEVGGLRLKHFSRTVALSVNKLIEFLQLFRLLRQIESLIRLLHPVSHCGAGSLPKE